jgi:hypothetical protein
MLNAQGSTYLMELSAARTIPKFAPVVMEEVTQPIGKT